MNELELQSHAGASLWHNNPTLVHLLGLSPLLAISDRATTALAMGIGITFVCIFSALSSYLLAARISGRWRFVWYSILLATYTSCVSLILELAFYELSRELGIYTALIACNLALVLKMEFYAEASSLPLILADAFKLSLSLLLALVGFALARELLLTGHVFDQWELLLPGTSSAPVSPEGIVSPEPWFRFMALQPAAFILLGLGIALGKLTGLIKPIALRNNAEVPVTRARVTGRLKKETD